jgi:hypothetical protein
MGQKAVFVGDWLDGGLVRPSLTESQEIDEESGAK